MSQSISYIHADVFDFQLMPGFETPQPLKNPARIADGLSQSLQMKWVINPHSPSEQFRYLHPIPQTFRLPEDLLPFPHRTSPAPSTSSCLRPRPPVVVPGLSHSRLV